MVLKRHLFCSFCPCARLRALDCGGLVAQRGLYSLVLNMTQQTNLERTWQNKMPTLKGTAVVSTRSCLLFTVPISWNALSPVTYFIWAGRLAGTRQRKGIGPLGLVAQGGLSTGEFYICICWAKKQASCTYFLFISSKNFFVVKQSFRFKQKNANINRPEPRTAFVKIIAYCSSPIPPPAAPSKSTV